MSESSSRWLDFARDDLRAARALATEGIHHLACFHAQPSAEKALKHVLTTNGRLPPRTHSLSELMDLSREFVVLPEDLIRSIEDLDDYYMPTRYPDAIPGSLPSGMPTDEHARAAITAVADLLQRLMTSSRTPL